MKMEPVRRPVRAPVRDLLDAQLGTHRTTCACVFLIYAQHRSGPHGSQVRTCASEISAVVMLAAREPHSWRKICRRACCDLGIQVKTRDYTGDCPMGYSWSLNGKRRHLNHAQKTAIGLELLPELEAEAKKRQATSTGGSCPQLSAPVCQAERKGRAALSTKQ